VTSKREVVVTCDRCYREAREDDLGAHQETGWKQLIAVPIGASYDHDDAVRADLCPQCWERIYVNVKP
jgi:hypothetical protein